MLLVFVVYVYQYIAAFNECVELGGFQVTLKSFALHTIIPVSIGSKHHMAAHILVFTVTVCFSCIIVCSIIDKHSSCLSSFCLSLLHVSLFLSLQFMNLKLVKHVWPSVYKDILFLDVFSHLLLNGNYKACHFC